MMHAQQESHYEFGVYLLITITFIMGLFALNCMITFYKLWTQNLTIITTRKPQSLFIFGFTITIALLIHDPLIVFASLYPTFFSDTYFIQNITMHIVVVGTLYILLYRMWMVYFDVKFIQALEDEEWQTQINTKTLKKSWFIQNRQKYGKPKVIALFLFCIWLICACAGTTMVILYGRSIQSLIFILFGVLVNLISLLVLSCKMPAFKDIYRLRIHTERTSRYSALSVAGIFLTVFILNGCPGQWKWLLAKLFNELFLITMVIGSFYFLKTFKLPIFYCSVPNSLVGNDLLEYSKSAQNKAENAETVRTHVKLSDILQSAEYFRLFAKQLTKEFAIENLLFFIETQQFVQYIGNQLQIPIAVKKSDENKAEEFTVTAINNIICAQNVPQSTIVKDLEDNESNENIKYIMGAINLFNKYIENDSYFLINISYETRQNLYDKLGYVSGHKNNENDMKNFMIKNNMTLKQIYGIFDEARLEILRLLMGALYRFKLPQSVQLRIQRNMSATQSTESV